MQNCQIVNQKFRGPLLAITNDTFHTAKLTLAKLGSNTAKFTCGPHVKTPHTKFTRVTCNLPVKTGKFTRVYVRMGVK